jgi:multidrug efflux pump subunit AcrA (membrane-fusion protein)
MPEPSVFSDPISSPLAPNRVKNLPPIKSGDFLPSISRWTTVGGLLLVGSIAVAAGLSAITEYRVTVPAPAQIRPAGELRLVQAATEGQVSRILNRENQFVARGEVIATLDNTKVIAQQNQLTNQGKQIQLGLAQFDAQIRTIDTQIQAEVARERATIASYQSKVTSIERNYRDKQLTAISTVQGAQANVNSAQNELREAQAQLKSNQADYLSDLAALKAAIVKKNRDRSVGKSGGSIGSKRDKLQISTASIVEGQANINSARSELQRATAQLKATQADYLSDLAALKSAIVKKNRYQSVATLGALTRNQIEEAELAVEQQQQKVAARKSEIEAQQQNISKLQQQVNVTIAKSRDRMEESDLAVSQQQQKVRSQQAAIEAQRQNIGKLQQNVNIAIAKLQTAKTQLDPSNAEIAIAKTSIPQEQATTASAIALLNREKQSLIQKKIELQREFDRNWQELAKSKLLIRETRVVATTDGIIAKLNLRNPGQIVKMGEEVAQLLPEHNPLAIEATVSPSEISKIAKGQRVEMKVSACPYPDYGTLGGKVTDISADTSQTESNAKNPLSTVTSNAVSFYRVRVRPDKLMLQQGEKKCPIKLGMEGGAEIVTSQETFLQFFMRKARLAVNF